jgi:ribosomal protein S18 acetylase RimI-like enzyme
MIVKLDWDSLFFEIKIGELHLEESKNKRSLIKAKSFDLLYVKSHKDFQLEINGFNEEFAETKVVFIKNLEKTQPISNSIFSANETTYKIEELYELAYESGKHSRFRLDNNFQEQQFKELYRQWVDNSILNIFADDVLIYQENNQTMGFVTYKVINKVAKIGLIAVKSDFQGKGIGGKLLGHVENLIFQKNIKELLIPTQLSNEAACSFYKKQNYQVHETTFIKHYWKNDTI